MKLQLIDGSSIELRFDTYFLYRVGKIAGKSLQELPYYLIGDAVLAKEEGQELAMGTCGIIADLECRAAVLAGAYESSNKVAGNSESMSLIDGFDIMNKIPSSFSSGIWGTMLIEIIKVVVPEAAEGEKKSVAKKGSPSTGGSSKRSASVK